MLTQDVDFKCVDSSGRPLPICFGVGSTNHRLFLTLQQLLNRLSMPAYSSRAPAVKVSKGFRPLLVDGFIGPATVAAIIPAMAVTMHLGLDPTPQVLHDFNGNVAPLTKESVAARAPELVAAFSRSVAEVEAKVKRGIEPPPQAAVGQLPPVTLSTVHDTTQIYFAQEGSWSKFASPTSRSPAAIRDFLRLRWRPAFDHWFRYQATRRSPSDKLGQNEISDLTALFRDVLYPEALAAGLSRDSFVFDPDSVADGREAVGQDVPGDRRGIPPTSTTKILVAAGLGTAALLGISYALRSGR